MPNISSEDFRNIMNRLRLSKADPVFRDFHFSTKKGPNGPAMATSPKDLASLPQKTIDNIITIGGDLLGSFIKKCHMPTPLGRLSFMEI